MKAREPSAAFDKAIITRTVKALTEDSASLPNVAALNDNSVMGVMKSPGIGRKGAELIREVLKEHGVIKSLHRESSMSEMVGALCNAGDPLFSRMGHSLLQNMKGIDGSRHDFASASPTAGAIADNPRDAEREALFMPNVGRMGAKKVIELVSSQVAKSAAVQGHGA